MGVLKNAWTDLHQLWPDIAGSSVHPKLKNSEDILLGFQTTKFGSKLSIVEHKTKNRTF